MIFIGFSLKTQAQEGNVVIDQDKDIEKLLKQLLNVEDEKFTKVDSWKTLKIIDSYGGPIAVFSGDLMGFVCSESDNSINIREIYTVIVYSGQTWKKIGFEPFSKLLGKTQEININKKNRKK